MIFNKKEKQDVEDAKTTESQDDVEVVKHEPGIREATATVEARHFYQTAYFRVTGIMVGVVVALILSIGFNIFLVMSKPKPVYFASTPDLRLAPMTPLSRPIMSQAALLDWSVETVAETLSLDFRNYQKQLTNVRDRYTGKAFKDLLDSLKASGNLRMVIDKRLSATCIATSAPIIEKAGELNGVYTWKLSFPMVISYEDSHGIQNEQPVKLLLTVERADTAITPKGILVKQIVTTPTN